VTVAHYFTFLRLILMPLFLITYLHPSFLNLSASNVPWMLALILLLSELSDACDGFLARRMNQVTDLGKILDPMADSLSRLGVYFCFSHGVVALPLEIPLLMLYRDVLISTLRTICALKGFALAARWSGKVKAVVQAIGAFCIIAAMKALQLDMISQNLFEWITVSFGLLACALSLFSGCEYFIANKKYFKQLLSMSSNHHD
jgi:CDP-diacylglycerol--glycerol-3-phosphate 3-phosphatidyltransferase